MLDKCDCVRKGVMDYRYFESKMKQSTRFADNFSVEMIMPSRLEDHIEALIGAEIREEHERLRLRTKSFVEPWDMGDMWTTHAHSVMDGVSMTFDQDLIDFASGPEEFLVFDPSITCSQQKLIRVYATALEMQSRTVGGKQQQSNFTVVFKQDAQSPFPYTEDGKLNPAYKPATVKEWVSPLYKMAQTRAKDTVEPEPELEPGDYPAGAESERGGAKPSGVSSVRSTASSADRPRRQSAHVRSYEEEVVVAAEAHAGRVFQDVDTDGTGFLSAEQFADAVKRLSADFHHNAIAAEYNSLDVDRVGKVLAPDFVAWWIQRPEALGTHVASPDQQKVLDYKATDSRSDMATLDLEVQFPTVHTDDWDFDPHGDGKSGDIPYPRSTAIRAPILRVRLQRFLHLLARAKTKTTLQKATAQIASLVNGAEEEEEQDFKSEQVISLRAKPITPDRVAAVQASLAELVGSQNVSVELKPDEEEAAIWLENTTRDELLRESITQQAMDILKSRYQMTVIDMLSVSTLATRDHRDSTHHLLKEFEATNGGIRETVTQAAEDIVSWLMERHGLWEHTIKRLGHDLGNGIAELMTILKSMLLLNLALGAMWFFAVILPRDYTEKESPAIVFYKVISEMFRSSITVGKGSLFYDGYLKTQGYLKHMGVMYFLAILGHMLVSLFVLVHKLNIKLSSLAGGQAALSLSDETERNWPDILSSYDISACDVGEQKYAAEMRQGIRQRIEMAIVTNTENERRKGHLYWLQIEVRQLIGLLLTAITMILHIIGTMFVMKYERRLGDIHPMVGAFCLSIMDSITPQIIRFIVANVEAHVHSIEVLHTVMRRVFIVKLVQLATIVLSVWQIMSVYVAAPDTGLPLECKKYEAAPYTCTFETLNITDTSEQHVSSTYSESAQKDLWFFHDQEIADCRGQCKDEQMCPEAHVGELFLRLVATDALVAIGIVLGQYVLVVYGIPNIFGWRSVVNQFDPNWLHSSSHSASEGKLDKTDMPRAVKLLKRRKKFVNPHSFAMHLLTGRHAQFKEKTHWFMLGATNKNFRQLSVKSWFETIETAVLHDDSQSSAEATEAAEGKILDDDQELLKHDRAKIHKKLEKDPKFVERWLTRICEAILDQGCVTVGHFIDLGWTDEDLSRHVGMSVPKCIARAVLNSEGRWVDVSHIVRKQRFFRLPPPEFNNTYSGDLIIKILFRQAFVWIGAPFCPWLPLVAALMQLSIFVAMKFAMLGGAFRAPAEPWSAGQTEHVFFQYALVTLLFCVLVITVWLNNTPLCGPHQGHQIFETLGEYMHEQESATDQCVDSLSFCKLKSLASFVARFLVNPPTLIIVIFVMWARNRFARAQLADMQKE
eukprot:COSAG01_NODE_635_length_14662_cov_12.488773_4_plen_1348_part_00